MFWIGGGVGRDFDGADTTGEAGSATRDATPHVACCFAVLNLFGDAIWINIGIGELPGCDLIGFVLFGEVSSFLNYRPACPLGFSECFLRSGDGVGED